MIRHLQSGLLTAALLLLSLSCFAKEPASDKHLMFRDIAITGTEKDMKASLRDIDFRWGMEGFLTGYIGNVAGEKMALQILTTPESEVVYALVAHSDKILKWAPLKQKYLDIKENLHKKYGRPISHSERFHKLALSGNAKRRAVIRGKCDYRSTFRAPGGTVTVYIDSDRRVCIEFQDAQGAAINEKEVLSEL